MITSSFQRGRFSAFASRFLGQFNDVVEIIILIRVLIRSFAKLFAQLTIFLKLFFIVYLIPKVFHDLPYFRFSFLRSDYALRDFKPVEFVLINAIFYVIWVLLAKVHMRKAVDWSFAILYADLKLASISSELSFIHLNILVDTHL